MHQLVDERREARDRRLDVGIPAADLGPLVTLGLLADALVEERGEFGRRRGEVDTAELGELGTEVDLMVVNDFTQAFTARYDDGRNSAAPRIGDQAGAAVAYDDVRGIEQAIELLGREERRPLANWVNRCGSPLHEKAADVLGVLPDPVINPFDEAVERMVISADGHQDARRGRAAGAGRGRFRQNRPPITLPRR